ncbi:hypothetical protein I305_01565 [Cryptococcus gattii E566]|uniref:Uncharacterized protein n=1 Tax=Cryptococcus gattii EJB2 TaxID=1296103 RepID=A0ABR5BPV6_9TREE|nr:hypothetical protein I306_05419 [Cryptococcus gattii EJB2]KIY35989.1 hypothetical protein I305_01565 [Cryptococcus gattii E566]
MSLSRKNKSNDIYSTRDGRRSNAFLRLYIQTGKLVALGIQANLSAVLFDGVSNFNMSTPGIMAGQDRMVRDLDGDVLGVH